MAAKTHGELNDKQMKFAREYMKDPHGTQAAIKAGYSPKSAYSQASALLKNPKISAYLAELKRKAEERSNIDLDECIAILANIAKADLADIYDEDGSIKPIHEIPKETRMAIGGMDTEELFESRGRGVKRKRLGAIKKIKMLDRTKSVEDLIKYFGGFEAHNRQKQTDINIFQDIDLTHLSPEELKVFKKVVARNRSDSNDGKS